jgi:hypothetical protein
MGMYASSHFYETGFNTIKTNAKMVIISNTQHTNMTSAIANALAWSTGCASTDFVVSSNTSGYILKISTNADLIAATALEATGVASHICVGTTATLYYITTCTTKALGAGDTVTMPTWQIAIKDPTS